MLDGFGDIVPLGSGGLGDVYRAVRLSTGSNVAIKVLRDWSDESAAWQRAQRELRALVDLQGHPFVVHIEEVVEVGGVPHLVMEYAPGGSVADLLRARGGPLDIGEVVLVGEQTSSALSASHRRGIIHLDIKPQNLLIGPFGQVKVCDFGIAALTQTEQFRERTSAASYRYASPEQLDEAPDVGPPADVYALGATLIHLLTGRPLVVRGDVTGRSAPLEWDRPHGLDPDVATRLDALLRACTAIDPAARPDIEDVHDELESIAVGLGELRRKALPLAPPPVGTAAPTVIRPITGQTGATMPPPPPTILAAPVAPPAPPAEPARRRSRWPWVAAAAAVVAVIAAGAVFALGGGGGSDAGGDTASAAVTVATGAASGQEATAAEDEKTATTGAPTTAGSTTTTTVAVVEVPDVAGEPLADAQAALTDAGLASEVVEVEGPGPYGEVVGVEPRVGSDAARGDVVVLTVNRQPAVMPGVVGETVAVATRTLESYGVDVTTTEVISEGAVDGAVTDQTPKPGEAFATTAQLVVNRQPAIVYLADLEPVDVFNAGFDTGQAQLNGEIFTRSVLLEPGGSRPGFFEYDLARSFTRLVGTVGPRDDVSAASVFKVEIFLDGTAVFDQMLGLGQAVGIDLDVTNALRLRLQVTDLSEDTRGDYVVFADTRALGVPGAVPTTTTD